MFGADIKLDDLHLRCISLVPLFSGLQFLLLLLQLFLSCLVLLLFLFQLFLSLLDIFIALIELLQVIDLHLYISLIYRHDFLIKLFDLFLKIFYLLVHSFDIQLSLPEVFSSLVFLLLEMLFEEAEVAGSFVVDFLATTFSADGGRAISTT